MSALRLVRTGGNGSVRPQLFAVRGSRFLLHAPFVRNGDGSLGKKYVDGWHFGATSGGDAARLSRVADQAPSVNSKRGRSILRAGT